MCGSCVIHRGLCALIMALIQITVPVALLSVALSQGSSRPLAHSCATLHVTRLSFTRTVQTN